MLLMVVVDGNMLLVVAVGEVAVVLGHRTYHGFWSPFFSTSLLRITSILVGVGVLLCNVLFYQQFPFK